MTDPTDRPPQRPADRSRPPAAVWTEPPAQYPLWKATLGTLQVEVSNTGPGDDVWHWEVERTGVMIAHGTEIEYGDQAKAIATAKQRAWAVALALAPAEDLPRPPSSRLVYGNGYRAALLHSIPLLENEVDLEAVEARGGRRFTSLPAELEFDGSADDARAEVRRQCPPDHELANAPDPDDAADLDAIDALYRQAVK